jgi:hypothetical protein
VLNELVQIAKRGEKGGGERREKKIKIKLARIIIAAFYCVF